LLTFSTYELETYMVDYLTLAWNELSWFYISSCLHWSSVDQELHYIYSGSCRLCMLG